LEDLLDTDGSMEYELIWNRKATASGLRIFRLRARGRPTSGAGCSGWPTCAALNEVANLSGWPTATAQDNDQVVGEFTNPKSGTTLGGAARLAGWASPRTADVKKNVRTVQGAMNELARKGSNSDLGTTAALAGCSSPRVPNGGRTKGTLRNDNGKPASNLETQILGVSGWSTPVAQPANGEPEEFLRRKRESVARGNSMGICLSDLQMMAKLTTPGPTSTSSPAETANSVVLDAAFSRWLMGFPQREATPGWDTCSPGWSNWDTIQELLGEWCERQGATASADCAPSATPSCPASQPSSSAPTCKREEVDMSTTLDRQQQAWDHEDATVRKDAAFARLLQQRDRVRAAQRKEEAAITARREATAERKEEQAILSALLDNADLPPTPIEALEMRRRAELSATNGVAPTSETVPVVKAGEKRTEADLTDEVRERMTDDMSADAWAHPAAKSCHAAVDVALDRRCEEAMAARTPVELDAAAKGLAEDLDALLAKQQETSPAPSPKKRTRGAKKALAKDPLPPAPVNPCPDCKAEMVERAGGLYCKACGRGGYEALKREIATAAPASPPASIAAGLAAHRQITRDTSLHDLPGVSANSALVLATRGYPTLGQLLFAAQRAPGSRLFDRVYTIALSALPANDAMALAKVIVKAAEAVGEGDPPPTPEPAPAPVQADLFSQATAMPVTGAPPPTPAVDPSEPPILPPQPPREGAEFITHVNVREEGALFVLWRYPDPDRKYHYRYVGTQDARRFGNWDRSDLAEDEYWPTPDEMVRHVTAALGRNMTWDDQTVHDNWQIHLWFKAGREPLPPAPAPISPPRLKGEDVHALGVERSAIEASYVAVLLASKPVPAVKPVTLSGRQWVCVDMCSQQFTAASVVHQGHPGLWDLTWTLRPLLPVDDYQLAHGKDCPIRRANDEIDREDAYAGRVVTVGRGKAKREFVIGVAGEQRRLLLRGDADA
jgi:hypothetical protein